MSFSLKNTRAIYQHKVNTMSVRQIGINMEVYMDDMLVKSKYVNSNIADLIEAFEVLRRCNMTLNPKKVCLWHSGKFLGFMVNQQGIEANPCDI